MFIYICMSTKIILQSHGLEIILLKNKLDKWFPLQGKLIPLKLLYVPMLGFQKQKRKEKEEEIEQQTYQFTAR